VVGAGADEGASDRQTVEPERGDRQPPMLYDRQPPMLYDRRAFGLGE